MDHIKQKLQPVMVEHEVTAEILYYFQSRGISRLAFSPLIVRGNLKPVMVREITGRCFQIGDTTMIDTGTEYQGYQAVFSRTFVLGEPNAI